MTQAMNFIVLLTMFHVLILFYHPNQFYTHKLQNMSQVLFYYLLSFSAISYLISFPDKILCSEI